MIIFAHQLILNCDFMNPIKFSISISAPAEKVWKALWNEPNYNKWTSVFSEGSHAETDWKEGSKVLFLDGKGSGMSSVIDKVVPNRQMTFKHLGMVKDGVELPPDEKSKEWAGAKESYYLSEENGITELKVEMDATQEFEQYFNDIFPKALSIVKQISESKP